jgi:aspartyl-tRNA(Asn)/glutamyl-tRNA(Gln) amidotransferase subunit C
MSISQQQIEYLAKLSALELTPDLIAKTQTALSQTFDILDKLKDIDVTGVEPLHYPLDVLQEFNQPLREDWANNPSPEQQMASISQAPESEGGLYLVPKVIGG